MQQLHLFYKGRLVTCSYEEYILIEKIDINHIVSVKGA